MSLALDVKLLKSSRGAPFGPEVALAAENVMLYLDAILDDALLSGCLPELPRGYYFDVTGRGYCQLCMPQFVESEEQAARIFAGDVAQGLLEEICEALDPERSEHTRSELGL